MEENLQRNEKKKKTTNSKLIFVKAQKAWNENVKI